MKFKIKPVIRKEEQDDEVVEKPDDVLEERVEEVVRSYDEVDSDSNDSNNSDDKLSEEDILKFAELMKEKGEGSVRDCLYNSGYEIDSVDRFIEEIHIAVKSGVKVNGRGMYASGGVKSLVDEDTIFEEDFDVEDDDEEDDDEPKKKKSKKSEFDDPVVEVFEMLKEGDPIPIKLAEKLLGNKENLERLLTMDGVEKSKYQVFIKSPDEIEDAAK